MSTCENRQKTQIDSVGRILKRQEMLPEHLKKQYQEHISSPKWKAFRRLVLESRKRLFETCDGFVYSITIQNYCESCGWNYPQDKLEIHHKHYLTLGKETFDDIAVVCPWCHEKLDAIRSREGERRANDAREDARIEGLLSKKYGELWFDRWDCDSLIEEAVEALESYDTEDYY